MKIYPGNHNISTSEEVTVNHLPLAYFTNVVKTTYPVIHVEDQFSKEIVTDTPYPYQQFSTDNIYFFNENNETVEGSVYLKRSGTNYYFEPIDSTEFVPTEFNIDILIARNDTYKNNVNYNISIGCASTELSEKIIGLVNGENRNKPSNIIINNDSLIPESLINLSYNNTDFLFINKTDLDSDKITEYLNNHINLWIVSDDFEELLTEDETITGYTLLSPIIYQESTFTLDGYNKVKFDLTKQDQLFPAEDYEYISIFDGVCPVLILKKENGAFIILSHSSLLDHTDTCYNVIFEVLMNVYLNSYFKASTITNYITDNKIDYFIKMYKRFNQYHPRINLTEQLYKSGYDTNINYDIVSITTGREDVIYTGLNKYNDMLFRKTSKTDPEKPDGTISVFTTNNTVVNYNSRLNSVKLIEDKLTVTYKTIDDVNYIEVSKFRSSSNKINKPYAQLIEITDNAEYILCFDSITDSFFVVRSIIYNEEQHGIKFATIKLDYSEELSCGDIRNYGGGESDNSEPNYEMIDTGSLKGRPFRLGSTMIIKLPKRFEQYKSILESELQKHISSGDYPILIFEN